MKVISVKQKAAAFDALVKELQGRYTKLIRYQQYSSKEMSNTPLAGIQERMEMRQVPVFEWRLQCVGNKNIEKGLLLLAEQRKKK